MRPLGIILLYHRITKSMMDPWGLCVTPQHFTAHLEILRTKYTPIALSEFIRSFHSGNVPEHAVVVTFDDGYVDNYRYALPLLVRYQVPATVFVSTGYTDRANGFWWDELQAILLNQRRLPEFLAMRIDGVPHEWNIKEAYEYTAKKYASDCRVRAWNATPGTRLHLYFEVWKLLRSLTHEARECVMSQIRSWANVLTIDVGSNRAMNRQELKKMAENHLITIGAHTVNHPFLPALTVESQVKEIAECKEQLYAMTGSVVQTLAYPHGKYTIDTVQIAKTQGLICACTSKEGGVFSNTETMLLPRVTINNIDSETFSRQLSRWFLP